MIAPFDIMPVLVAALLEERQHWRETAAANISTLCRAIDSDHLRPRIPGPKLPASAIRAELKEWTLALEGAVSGDLSFATCEACDHPVRPGQLVVPFSDVGEMHAECCGVPPDQLKVGGIITLSPEEIPEPEEGEPAHPGYVVVYASESLYTDAQILARLEGAKRVLERAQ